ncbi:MAG: penicillin-binding protein 2 [Proteobacteria bacterium]|nr:penicillin-binding protein 2 [Pseudomonadota bacterium]
MSPVRIKDLWREQRIFDRRALFASAAMVLLLLALLGRLYLLQVRRHDYYSALSQENRVRTEPIPAARGLIMDRYGEVIASNQPTFQLELVPDEVPKLESSLERLAKLGLLQAEDIPDLLRTIRSRRSFDSVPIKLHLSEDQVARFAVHRYEFPGIDIKPRQARWYPDGPLAVDAIGYVGTINAQDLKHINAAAYAGTAVIGKTGVEAAYEKQLHGTNGYRQFLVDANGRPVQRPGVFAKDLETKAPVPGEDMILSLDLKVQRVAEQLLGGRPGAVVALDPWNGNIIALASSPSFDPNLFARGISEQQYRALMDDPQRPLFNRALRAQLPSGSTIKPALALGALTDGVVDPQLPVYSPWAYHLPGSRHLYHNAMHENCGSVDLAQAIIVSCDVYFYRLAHEMGIDRIGAWLPNLGFGRPTGIDIPGEQSGLSPSRAWKASHFRDPAQRVWFPGDTVILGIGQGYFLVTPLQLAHYTAILATRGLAFAPRLVTGLRDPRTGKIHWKRPRLDGDLTMISPASWKVVDDAMVGVTSNPRGTAYWQMRGSPYAIAGKTGTAQVVAENAKGAANEREYGKQKTLERLRDDAWFIAFAPAEAPRIAVAVLVEHAGWGDIAAAPIARKIMDAYLLGPNGKLLPHPGRARFSEPRDIPPRLAPGVAKPTPLQQQIAEASP